MKLGSGCMGEFRRGNIYWCDLSPAVGSEQAGVRPCLVISNNLGNHFSPVVQVAPISTSSIKHLRDKKMPTHVLLKSSECGLDRDSIVFLEHNRTVDKLRLGDFITSIDDETMKEVKVALDVVYSDTLDYTPRPQYA
jgi:mRNA interferase MazF